ncbi:rhamnogalacturonan lyase [Massilia sp. LjRoot122]|uniref:rhamnogalacturonan lyase n=1 Tax=Massilia sp. LjRoot122 TaxID=3342257 RepID=UPI003ECEFC45
MAPNTYNDTLQRSIALGLLALACSACTTTPPATTQAAGRQLERLDRGVVAIPAQGGNFVSWRALGGEDPATAFNLYRDGKRLNDKPLAATNFMDAGAGPNAAYSVRPVRGNAESSESGKAAAAWPQSFLSIPLRKPADGVTPDGVAYSYVANDGSAADLDGDGRYELLVKWQPTNAKDNSQGGYTGSTYIDAYRLDGSFMWRIDLGRNIRAGAHYTTYLAYDFDGDGRAEVMMKTADGSVDGQGKIIGDAKADYRNERGVILAGPEFLTVFDGRSGAALASTDYLPARGGDGAAWGDSRGNRVDRFLGGVAYLDGKRPSAIFARGYYTRAVLAAWDWRDGKLTQRWIFDSDTPGNETAAGQGAHWMAVADADADGHDDIVYGAATIRSDGKLMYSTGLCHGDALHVGKHDPSRPGLQVFMVHESPKCYRGNGAAMRDAATGTVLWGMPSTIDVGRGICMDIDPAHPGNECWAALGGITNPAGGLVNAQGVQISATRPRAFNFGLWWDGDLLRESLDGTKIEKWNPQAQRLEPLLDAAPQRAASNNGTKANPVLSADLFGDWREEVVWRSNNDDALLVFSTTAPTRHRMPTLMHDSQYRVQVAAQNAAYNQPPHPSFFLGEGMTPPPSTNQP